MFNWFKNLFNTKQVDHVDEHHEEDVKDISEPVISLLKCVQDNPERFMCDNKRNSMSYLARHNFRLYDKETRTLLKGSAYLSEDYFIEHPIFSVNEVEYLYRGISKVYNDIKEKKETKYRESERKRLIGLYCK